MIIDEKHHMTNNITSAEAIADLLYLSDNLNLDSSKSKGLKSTWVRDD